MKSVNGEKISLITSCGHRVKQSEIRTSDHHRHFVKLTVPRANLRNSRHTKATKARGEKGRRAVADCLPPAVPRPEGGAPGQELLPDPRADSEIGNLHQHARSQLSLQTAARRISDRTVNLRAASQRRLLHPRVLREAERDPVRLLCVCVCVCTCACECVYCLTCSISSDPAMTPSAPTWLM